MLINKHCKKKTYLLIPSVPTPNGRLHLGHMGGPFLSVDILARHYRIYGHQAHIIAGTDSYDSHVIAQAAKEQKTPEQICHYYHNLITKDLAAFDISVDAMINPLAEKWQDDYQNWHNNILTLLAINNAITELNERVLWDHQQQHYRMGCWLNGNCPICQESIAGYFCESCGAHFKPEEVEASNNENSIIRKVNNFFMRLSHSNNLTKKGISVTIEKIYQNFLKKQDSLMRLTANCDWGLNSPDQQANLQQRKLFNYGFMFAYFLMMGEIAGKLNTSHSNAFNLDSEVITIASFGLDNAVPFLASIYGISDNTKQYKSFDYYLVNHFYHLNGSKFSTSRNHAIWANEIVYKAEALSDIVRLYLAKINVRQKIGNFDIAEFLAFYNETVNAINNQIIQPLLSLDTPNKFPQKDLIESLQQLLAQQEQALHPQDFSPHIAVKTLAKWLQQHISYADYYWWLKGFVLLAYPFMPKISELLWQALGYDRLPNVMNFSDMPKNKLKKTLPLTITHLTEKKLQQCLPTSLCILGVS